MDHLYNVVWADDEIDTLLEDSKSQFARAGIEIIPFHDAASAIDYVRNNASFVDGIISDAKYPKAGEAFQEEGKSFPGLSFLMQNLSGLRKECKQPFPCWIYTGYGELLLDKYDNENDLSCFEGVIDKKASYDQTKDWIQSICDRIAVTKSPEFKIRQANPEIFALCTDNYLGKTLEREMYDIIAYQHEDNVDPFNRFRDVVEEIMDLLYREGQITGVSEKISIKARIDQFEQKQKNNRNGIPEYIIPSLRLLLSSSALSHSDTLEKKEVIQGHAPRMYDTLLTMMTTVLIWLKIFIDKARTQKDIKSDLKAISQSAKKPDDSSFKNQDTQSDEDDSLDLSVLHPSLLGTQTGKLVVKQYGVELDDSKEVVSINWKKVQKENKLKPGQKLRVRVGTTTKGEKSFKEVTEVVRIEN